MYQQEPFIRLVKERTGVYRYPEPKILAVAIIVISVLNWILSSSAWLLWPR